MPYPNVTQFETLDRRARRAAIARVRMRRKRVLGRIRRPVLALRLRRHAAPC